MGNQHATHPYKVYVITSDGDREFIGRFVSRDAAEEYISACDCDDYGFAFSNADFEICRVTVKAAAA